MCIRDRFLSLAENVRGVVFLGTPNQGAALARVADFTRTVTRPSAATLELSENAPHLRVLNTWYRNFAQDQRLHHLVLCETRRISGILIVDQGSADPGVHGVVPIPVDEDHSSIAKPGNREQVTYLLVRNFVSTLRDATFSEREVKENVRFTAI